MRWRLVLSALLGIIAISIGSIGVIMPELIPSVQLISEILVQYEFVPAMVSLSFVYAAWIVLSRGRIASIRMTINEEANNGNVSAVGPPEAEAASPESDDIAKDAGVDKNSLSILGITVLKFADAPTEAATTDSVNTESPKQEDQNSGTSQTESVFEQTGNEGTAKGGSNNPTSVSPEVFDHLRIDPLENVQLGEETVVGAEFEQLLSEEKTNLSAMDPYENEALSKRLQHLLIDLEDRPGRTDDETVGNYIQSGLWTDDRVAAAFLSPDGSVSPPLKRRIFAWLDPEAELEYAVSRTITEIANQYGDKEVHTTRDE